MKTLGSQILHTPIFWRLLFCWGWLLPARQLASPRRRTIFESGTLGPTGLTFADFDAGGAPDSSGVETNVFSGVRFELTESVLTTRVGGHFVIQPNADDSLFWRYRATRRHLRFSRLR